MAGHPTRICDSMLPAWPAALKALGMAPGRGKGGKARQHHPTPSTQSWQCVRKHPARERYRHLHKERAASILASPCIDIYTLLQQYIIKLLLVIHRNAMALSRLRLPHLLNLTLDCSFCKARSTISAASHCFAPSSIPHTHTNNTTECHHHFLSPVTRDLSHQVRHRHLLVGGAAGTTSGVLSWPCLYGGSSG